MKHKQNPEIYMYLVISLMPIRCPSCTVLSGNWRNVTAGTLWGGEGHTDTCMSSLMNCIYTDLHQIRTRLIYHEI